jgi:hypothetical protein
VSSEGLRRYATRNAEDEIDLQIAQARVRDMKYGGCRVGSAREDENDDEPVEPWGPNAPKPKAKTRRNQKARQRLTDKGAAGDVS